MSESSIFRSLFASSHAAELSTGESLSTEVVAELRLAIDECRRRGQAPTVDRVLRVARFWGARFDDKRARPVVQKLLCDEALLVAQRLAPKRSNCAKPRGASVRAVPKRAATAPGSPKPAPAAPNRETAPASPQSAALSAPVNAPVPEAAPKPQECAKPCGVSDCAASVVSGTVGVCAVKPPVRTPLREKEKKQKKKSQDINTNSACARVEKKRADELRRIERLLVPEFGLLEPDVALFMLLASPSDQLAEIARRAEVAALRELLGDDLLRRALRRAVSYGGRTLWYVEQCARSLKADDEGFAKPFERKTYPRVKLGSSQRDVTYTPPVPYNQVVIERPSARPPAHREPESATEFGSAALAAILSDPRWSVSHAKSPVGSAA